MYREYQRRLLEASALDFDDLLVQTVHLFRDHPDARERWSSRFHHVLVDEFQDTNVAQWELVRMLTEEHRNVMVVGDQDQSIYKFRGADFRNLLKFEEVFPEATVIVMEQNYRSSQRILDAANAVIANNAARRPKHLWTEQIGGELITRYHAEDEHDEAAFVVHEIGRLVDTEHHRFGDVAVFYRTNAQSRVIEETLVRAGVPYRVVGRREVLRPARGEGRPRLPARAGEPRRRGELAPRSSTRPSAASATRRSTRCRRTRRAPASRSATRCRAPSPRA